MGIFDGFKVSQRTTLPVLFYQANQGVGKAADPDDFPPEIADTMMLLCKRLHRMGVFPETQTLSLSLPKMLEALADWDVLQGVALSDVDTAVLVFGDGYANCWYTDPARDAVTPYLLPQQLVFYHSGKPHNYFFSLLADGLDLRANTVVLSNGEDLAEISAKTGPLRIGVKGMAELKSAYHILFTYLKYLMLIKKEALGCNAFIDAFSTAFCHPADVDELAGYAKNYFSLNGEKKDLYPQTYVDCSFGKLLETLVLERGIGLALDDAAFSDIYTWLGQRLEPPRHRAATSRLDLLLALSVPLKATGHYLWLWQRSAVFSDAILLIADKAYPPGLENSFAIDLWPVDQRLVAIYRDELHREERIRALAAVFYPLVGATDVAELLVEIRGTEVLDEILYERDHLIFFDWKEDDIAFSLQALLERNGLSRLWETLAVDGLLPDEAQFVGDVPASPYDRMALYAEPLRRHGKRLVYLDTGSDAYHFALIANGPMAEAAFIRVADELVDLGEVEGYTLF